MATTISSNFQDRLIQSVKDVGQEIIDRAEDIVGEANMLSFLNISIDFDPEGSMCIPTINVNRKYAVRRIIDRLINHDLQE